MGRISKSKVRRVIELHTEAKTYAEASRFNAEQSLQAAWKCGRALNVIRSDVPHGSWERWCKNAIPELSSVTIWRYRKLAAEFEQLPDLKRAASIRQAYLQLGIGSERPAANSDNDIKLRGSGSVLNTVNSLTRWLNEEEEKKPFNNRSDDDLIQLRRDFRPVYDRLRNLFECPRGKESFSGGKS